MLKRQAVSTAKTTTAEAAAGLVISGMWLDYGAISGAPDRFDRALAARTAELHDVKIRRTLSTGPRAVLEADPDRQHFHMMSLFFSGYDRKKRDLGRCEYIPNHLGEIDDLYRRYIDPVDIVVIKTCPIDAGGNFNLSTTTLWHRAVIERAKLVIVETSTTLPYCYGVDNSIHVSEVDYIIDGDNAPVFELPKTPATEVDRAVARLIAAEIEDGSCLQVGIGGMPNAVCSLLLDSSVRSLGVHTEMLTDGIIDLYKSGQITGTSKTLDPGKYDNRGTPRSRIVLDLTQSNIVTTPRSDMMYVVTEYGIVNLKGKSVAQRAKAMISIAHPSFREDLERQACEHRLIPKGFTI
jgi:acyl-CoA hydrolase